MFLEHCSPLKLSLWLYLVTLADIVANLEVLMSRTRDVQDDGKGGRTRKRRRSRSIFSLRNILRLFGMVIVILFLLFLYSVMV